MVTVAGLAFWRGGWVLDGFVIALGLGIFAEWTMLVLAFEKRSVSRGLWLVAGAGYIGFAIRTALILAQPRHVFSPLAMCVGIVIAVDVGAYFSGRTFGGPKIAPSISPSKTWNGLYGAGLAASVAYWLFGGASVDVMTVVFSFVAGALTAVVAQSGDFLESWMKRRAGVKDSGSLLPGHGGLFDRADGLIAVLFVMGLGIAASIWSIRQ